MLLQATLSLSLVVSSLKSVCCDFLELDDGKGVSTDELSQMAEPIEMPSCCQTRVDLRNLVLGGRNNFTGSFRMGWSPVKMQN